MSAVYSDQAVALLKERMPDNVLSVDEFHGEKVVAVDREAIIMAGKLLYDDPDLRFNLLACLTAVDWWPEEPRFAVDYRLYSVPNNDWIGLRVILRGDDEEIPSIESVYPNANWHEREIYDMFGIHFRGHSDMRRILMPHDWEGHPLRKDYPLGYEEVQFTFNFDEIDRKKPYAKE